MKTATLVKPVTPSLPFSKVSAQNAKPKSAPMDMGGGNPVLKPQTQPIGLPAATGQLWSDQEDTGTKPGFNLLQAKPISAPSLNVVRPTTPPGGVPAYAHDQRRLPEEVKSLATTTQQRMPAVRVDYDNKVVVLQAPTTAETIEDELLADLHAVEVEARTASLPKEAEMLEAADLIVEEQESLPSTLTDDTLITAVTTKVPKPEEFMGHCQEELAQKTTANQDYDQRDLVAFAPSTNSKGVSVQSHEEVARKVEEISGAIIEAVKRPVQLMAPTQAPAPIKQTGLSSTAATTANDGGSHPALGFKALPKEFPKKKVAMTKKKKLRITATVIWYFGLAMWGFIAYRDGFDNIFKFFDYILQIFHLR